MTSISLRLDDDLLESLDEEAEEKGVSRSAYIRATLEARHESDVLRKERDELQADYEALEARRDELQRQLAAVNARQEDVTELVEYVEQERTLQQQREDRRNAPVWTRAKWWLFGKSTDGDGS